MASSISSSSFELSVPDVIFPPRFGNKRNGVYFASLPRLEELRKTYDSQSTTTNDLPSPSSPATSVSGDSSFWQEERNSTISQAIAMRYLALQDYPDRLLDSHQSHESTDEPPPVPSNSPVCPEFQRYRRDSRAMAYQEAEVCVNEGGYKPGELIPCSRQGCKNVLRNVNALAAHLRIHNIADCACDMCGKVYNTRRALELHNCSSFKATVRRIINRFLCRNKK